MKILFIGDIYAAPGREILKHQIKELKQTYVPDLIVVNAENTTNGRGLSFKHYKELMGLGIDVLTMGNHVFGKDEIFDFISETPNLVRPLNGHPNWPGNGYHIININNKRVAILNLLGTNVGFSAVNPFVAFDEFYQQHEQEFDVLFVDFHAEFTSEKIAFGYHVSNRAQVCVGTHTHVPTADNRILEQYTAYISDVGMTGPLDGVIGVKREIILKRMIKGYTERFEVAAGRKQLNAVSITIDDTTNKALAIERIHMEED